MAAINWEKLKQDAIDTIKSIDTDKLDKPSYMLLGAAVAILDHDDDKSMHVASFGASESPQMRDAMDELNSAEHYLMLYKDTQDRDYLQMAHDETTHYDKFAGQLMAQGMNISDMQARMDEVRRRIKMYAGSAAQY